MQEGAAFRFQNSSSKSLNSVFSRFSSIFRNSDSTGIASPARLLKHLHARRMATPVLPSHRYDFPSATPRADVQSCKEHMRRHRHRQGLHPGKKLFVLYIGQSSDKHGESGAGRAESNILAPIDSSRYR
jgi:hypothetical protein